MGYGPSGSYGPVEPPLPMAIVSGLSRANDVGPASPVDSALMTLTVHVQRLGDVIEMLEKRTTPIRRSQLARPGSPTGFEKESSEPSPLVTRLRELTVKVADLGARVEQIIASLDC